MKICFQHCIILNPLPQVPIVVSSNLLTSQQQQTLTKVQMNTNQINNLRQQQLRLQLQQQQQNPQMQQGVISNLLW